MEKNIAAVTPETVPAISHEGHPVVTSKLLAAFYGVKEYQIRQNFSNNKGRFAEGKHFFLIEGQELREIKRSVESFYSADKESQNVGIAKNINKLTLWTERGAARHAKMLDTDQAWDVFEKLEECYFNRNATITPSQQRAIHEAISARIKDDNDSGKAYARYYGAIKTEFRVNNYKDLPVSQFNAVLLFIDSLAKNKQQQPSDYTEVELITDLARRCNTSSLGVAISLLAAEAFSIPYTVSVNFPNSNGKNKRSN